MTSRRAFLASVGTVGAAGLLPALPTRQAATAADDAILAHITGEFVRTHKDMKRLNLMRSDHARTLAANVRLLVIHSRSTLHLDEGAASRLRKGSPLPMPDHDRQRKELARIGVDIDSLPPMTHANQEQWDRFVDDTLAGVSITARLTRVADHLDATAARLGKNEAMNLNAPNGARVLLAQGSIDEYCRALNWDVEFATVLTSYLCSALAAFMDPAACGAAIVLQAALWLSWYFGCS